MFCSYCRMKHEVMDNLGDHRQRLKADNYSYWQPDNLIITFITYDHLIHSNDTKTYK